MKPRLPKVVLVSAFLLLCLAFWEYRRCVDHDLPWWLSAEELEGPVAPLLQRLGHPDVAYRTTKARLRSRGVGGVPLPANAVAGDDSRTVEVMIWERKCFYLFMSRTMFVVVAPDDNQIIYFDAFSRSGIAPVLVTDR